MSHKEGRWLGWLVQAWLDRRAVERRHSPVNLDLLAVYSSPITMAVAAQGSLKDSTGHGKGASCNATRPADTDKQHVRRCGRHRRRQDSHSASVAVPIMFHAD